MTKFDKLVARIKARPPEADFGDVEKLLRGYGWSHGRQSGSHVAFVKEGQAPIIFPLVRGRKVKAVYLDQIIERLGV